MKNKKMVSVNSLTYNLFFETYNNLSVPEYQRPYRWDIGKVAELLDDLKEFFITKSNTDLEYYMGSILLFDNKARQQFEIIDGQQRITTLILLEYAIKGKLTANQNLNYNHHISFSNIQTIKEYLKGKKELLAALHKQDFLNKLSLTIIVSESEDNAFTFFDSQNNRGVSLGAEDYLKAYHLRAVTSEALQAKLAQQWEQVIFQSQEQNNNEAGLAHLFYKVLYRSRQWKGQSRIYFENKDEILKSFQKQTRRSKNLNQYPLFLSRNNLKYQSIEVTDADTTELIEVGNTNIPSSELPFTLRQPLYKGHNFFQFTQKYHAIHQLLFFNKETDNEIISTVQEFYTTIYSHKMSIYLRHYMQMCLVMYYDAFGTTQLIKAVQYFDYFIGSIRIEKYYVRKEAVKNSLLHRSNNLLDVLAQAYLPEEIFEFIESQGHLKKVYEKENLEKKKGVRSVYKQSILTYYNQPDTNLKNRLQWIK
jgi:uncharacterized protein with ParB-like and HNH nuclease domain